MNPTHSALSALFDPVFWRKAVLLIVVLAIVVAASTLPLTYAIALVLGLGAVLVLLLWPELGLFLLIVSIPYGYLKEGTSGGLELSFTEPLVFVVAAIWLACGVSSQEKGRRFNLRSGPLYIPLLAFLWLVTFSLTTAPALAPSAKEVLKWAAVLVTYALVVSTVRTRRQVALLLATIFVAAVSESAIGLYQFLAKAGPKGFIIGSFLRAYGTFGQPNPYAGYLAVAAAIAFGLILYSIKTLASARPSQHIIETGKMPGWLTPLLLLAWVTFAACSVAIGMSLSRGAWLGLGVGLATITALSSRRALWIMLVVLVILGLFLAMGLMQQLPSQITDRISEAADYFRIFDVTKVELTPENWPIVERMAHWQAAWDMYLDHPLLGVGIGNYPDAYQDYYIANWKDAMGHAHNLYLNMLAEMGLVGLVGYLLLVASFLGYGFAVLRRLSVSAERTFERYVLVGLLGSLVVLSVHNLLDNLFVHGIGVQIGLILGLMTVLDQLGRRSGVAGSEGSG